MEILLQDKTFVFMEDVLVLKDYSSPIPYAQIAQVIYEKRYHSYDIVFYDEKIKNARGKFRAATKKTRKQF